MYGLTSYGTLSSFRTKADAIKFALEFTATATAEGVRCANYEQAQELFDFVCKNVNLPDTDAFQIEQMSGLVDKIIDGINGKKKEDGE